MVIAITATKKKAGLLHPDDDKTEVPEQLCVVLFYSIKLSEKLLIDQADAVCPTPSLKTGGNANG